MKKLIWSDKILSPQSQTEPTPIGWRVPTRTELLELFDSGDYPDEMIGKGFWSSTPYKPVPTYAWYVNFDYGGTFADNATYSLYVRLVRDEVGQ